MKTHTEKYLVGLDCFYLLGGFLDLGLYIAVPQHELHPPIRLIAKKCYKSNLSRFDLYHFVTNQSCPILICNTLSRFDFDKSRQFVLDKSVQI